MQTAITMHYTPGVTTAAGQSYLLAAGAAWTAAPELDLPPQTLNNAVRDYPRVGFKKAFADAFRAESGSGSRQRTGKVREQVRALITAIKLAPFDE